MSCKSLYQTLELPDDAPPEAIKSAYRRLAVRHHPDKCGGQDNGEAFKKISNAYQILSDPQKKARYDRYGDAVDLDEEDAGFGHPGGFRPAGYGVPPDFFDFLRRAAFGGAFGGPPFGFDCDDYDAFFDDDDDWEEEEYDEYGEDGEDDFAEFFFHFAGGGRAHQQRQQQQREEQQKQLMREKVEALDSTHAETQRRALQDISCFLHAGRGKTLLECGVVRKLVERLRVRHSLSPAPAVRCELREVTNPAVVHLTPGLEVPGSNPVSRKARLSQALGFR